MPIARPQLVRRIRPFYEDGQVKVITGMRRTGKSTLLRLIADDMKTFLGRSEESFVFLNFERLEWNRLTQPHALHEYLQHAIDNSPARVTLFLDEIQNVRDWETCINSLRADNRCDIFVTGSNSKLLSSELATHLAGRTIQFQVFPFSFAEYCAARRAQQEGGVSDASLWREYLVFGGMPGVVRYPTLEAAQQYLCDVFEGIALKDVAQRWNIRQTYVLERVYRYLLAEAGHRISAGNVEKYLKSEKLSLSRDALLEYMHAGVQTYAFEKVEGQDLQGKKVLRFQPKLYVADHGFREAYFPGSNTRNIDQVLENIVCIELLRRGWTLRVGDVEGKEMDFIAERGAVKLYVQVAYLLASDETVEREFSPLRNVPDNWPKLVLSMDPISRSQDGIEHKNITDFLLSGD